MVSQAEPRGRKYNDIKWLRGLAVTVHQRHVLVYTRQVGITSSVGPFGLNLPNAA
jgi:hypothetical protein